MDTDAASAAGSTPRRRALVHLVHGTWPRGLLPFSRSKLWFEEGSDFRASIAGPGIECQPFGWSGANSVCARAVAAVQLRARLKTRQEDLVQLVIAHSHGGNVAVQALSGPEGQGLVDGVVTLGTPFLHVRNRTAEPFETTAIGVAQMVGLLLLAMIGTFLWLPPELFSLKNWASLPLTTRLILEGMGTALVFLVAVLFYGWKTLHDRTVETASRALRSGLPLLILRAPRDEASVILSIAQLADVFLEMVWRLVRRALWLWTRFLPWLDDRRWASAFVLALVGGVVWSGVILAQGITSGQSLCDVLGAYWMGPVEAGYWTLVVWCIRTLLVLALAIGIPATVVLLPLGAMLVIAGLALAPFGWELVFAGLTLEVNAEATPAGSAYPVETIQPDRSELERARMRHSLHELPSVRARLLQWIIEHQEKVPARGPGDPSR